MSKDGITFRCFEFCFGASALSSWSATLSSNSVRTHMRRHHFARNTSDPLLHGQRNGYNINPRGVVLMVQGLYRLPIWRSNISHPAPSGPHFNRGKQSIPNRPTLKTLKVTLDEKGRARYFARDSAVTCSYRRTHFSSAAQPVVYLVPGTDVVPLATEILPPPRAPSLPTGVTSPYS